MPTPPMPIADSQLSRVNSIPPAGRAHNGGPTRAPSFHNGTLASRATQWTWFEVKG